MLTDEKSKWAANLWVWNGPRMGYSTAPSKNQETIKTRGSKRKKKDPTKLPGARRVIFKNDGGDLKFNKASLYYQETLWGDFGPGKSHSVNSFKGHVWNVKGDDGEGESHGMDRGHPFCVVASSNLLLLATVLLTWIVEDGEGDQHFVI